MFVRRIRVRFPSAAVALCRALPLIVLAAASGSSARAQPTDSLLLHLEFEGDLLDSSGNAHHGVDTGTLGFDTGIVGQATVFSGDDSVTMPSVPDDAFSTAPYSVTFWFDVPQTLQASLVGKRQICNVSPFFDIRSFPDEVNYAIATASASNVLVGPRDDGWRFYAAVREDGWIRLYLDGVLADQAPLPPIDIENTAMLGISTSPCIGADGTQMLEGSLDDLRIYTRSLTAEEVKSFVPGLIFGDGFETGELDAWTQTVP
ncbi:MAG: LamG domain-containing protein [Thermoanaerobaculia bacterium]|nr:LamG domain-containing protein [Thermoanaerobaculia bacterium]